MTARVLIADDHDITRYGLRALIELSGISVVGEARNGRQAVKLAIELQPDVVVMDLTMPELNGIDAASILREKCPQVRVVMLSMHSDVEHVHRAMRAGACGYLLKGSASDEVVSAVRAAALGRHYLSHDLAIDFALLSRNRNAGPLSSLSSRERQILQFVAEGRSSTEIGMQLHLSPGTVDTYRSRLMRKLGLADVASLVKFAVKHGLTPSE